MHARGQARGTYPELGLLATELGRLSEQLAAAEVRLPALEGPAGLALLRRLAAASRHLEAARHALLGTASSAIAAEPAREITAGLEGSTRTVPLQDLFSFLSTTGRTGALRVQAVGEHFVVHFAGGDVTYAFGDRVPPGEGLGEILCSRGVLTPEQLELLPSRAAQEAWLAPALLQSGWISRRDLEAALACQTRSAFLRLCRVGEARYGFLESARASLGSARFHPVELLLEATRLFDESRWRDALGGGLSADLGLHDAATSGPG